MGLILWGLLAVSTGVLARRVMIARGNRLRGESPPSYEAGNVPGALAMVLLIIGLLLNRGGYEGPVVYVVLGAAFVSIGLDIALTVRARRRGPGGPSRGEPRPSVRI